MTAPALSVRHALLALAVTIVWGTNFVVIKVGLGQLPPLTFAALRFALAFAPAALFLRRFVKNARRFAHFDIYGWRPAPKPLGPKGGEPHAARTMLAVIESLYRQA
jgi:drug/metabolite transporter (DMT)-like permease